MSNQTDRKFLDVIESETQSKSTVEAYFREVKNKWKDDVADKLDSVTRIVYRSNLLGSDAYINNTGSGYLSVDKFES